MSRNAHFANGHGKNMGWSSNPDWVSPKDRMYDIRESGAKEVRGSYNGGLGNRSVTYTVGDDAPVTGPTAKTKRGARKAMWKQINA